jgi:pimeloyl-ACP methyl ester carboxylesterase
MSRLAFERLGDGPPLMLLHGTNSSREVWKPLLEELSSKRDVIAVDLPAHGESAPSSFAPPDWALEVGVLMDELGLESVPIVGHSSGGWTALELAKLGRTDGVLALAPAGLWRKHSPAVTDAILRINWRLGQVLGERSIAPLRSRLGRRLALRQISGRPADVPADIAIAMAKTVLASTQFPEHFRQTRHLRFQGGQDIPATTAVHVVWGERDRVARAQSRRRDQLPDHARIDTWRGCGHMLMWDARERVVAAALELEDRRPARNRDGVI